MQPCDVVPAPVCNRSFYFKLAASYSCSNLECERNERMRHGLTPLHKFCFLIKWRNVLEFRTRILWQGSALNILTFTKQHYTEKKINYWLVVNRIYVVYAKQSYKFRLDLGVVLVALW
jgi:hypothetical protein